MKVAVTGAAGLLGSALCPVLARRCELVALSKSDCDVTSAERTLAVLERHRPDVVVHLAAYTNVDGCELDPARAALVNARGTDNVLLACRRIGAKPVYVSTDYVFEGLSQRPYREDDPARPLSAYGKSKLAGEWFCKARSPHPLIVRSAWLFGPGGRNFVSTVLEKARRGERLAVVNDQRGSPTYTVDLANALAALIERGASGVVHIVNSGEATWYELAVEALRLSGIDAEVEPITSARLGRPAPRPAYSVLAPSEIEGISPMRHWREALAEFLGAS